MYKNFNKAPKKENGAEPVIRTYATLFDVIMNIPDVRQHENKESPKFISLLAQHCNYAGIALSDAIREIQNKYNKLEESFVSTIVKQVYSECSGENGSKAFMYNLKVRNSFDDEDSQKLPYIPDEVFQNLPPILKEGTRVFRSKRERDVFFLGQLVVTGSLLTTYGIYRNKKSYTNLYCFIVASAASGKGSFLYAKQLGMKYHRYMRDNLNSMLFLPANISTAALYQILEITRGKGIFFESEADTMAIAFKQDWGGYSDILRKGFHYEPAAIKRKSEDKNESRYIEIEFPILSVALSGTWGQVKGIIGNTEDGLFSRIVFYSFSSEPFWDRFSSETNLSYDDFFSHYADEYSSVIENTKGIERFDLTKEQWDIFHDRFEKWLIELLVFYKDESSSIIKRLGEITFRIAMILTTMRQAENQTEVLSSSVVYCNETDFYISFLLAEVLKQHALFVYVKFSGTNNNPLDKAVQMLFESLPNEEFSRANAVNIGRLKIGLADRTVDKYLKNLLRAGYLTRTIHSGMYKKN